MSSPTEPLAEEPLPSTPEKPQPDGGDPGDEDDYDSKTKSDPSRLLTMADLRR